MALAFMLNPATARRTRKKRRSATKRVPKWMRMKVKNMTFAQCMAASKWRKKGLKCRTAAEKKALSKARAAERRLKKKGYKTQKGEYGDVMGAIQTNPRKKRRGKKGGSRMAATKRRKRRVSVKRSRAAKKGWRTWKRRHHNRKPRVGKRGRRNNPRYGKRRRNLWRDDTAGHRKAAKKGWRKRKKAMKKNPRRRRRNSMYSGKLYANPRRRRRNAFRRRRRNPIGFGGMFGGITKSLTDPKVLTQFAVGAAGASVSEMLGSFLTAKITEFAPETFADKEGMLYKLVGAATRVAAGVAVAAFLPAQYKMAWVLGSGTVAAQPLISGLLKPVLDPIGSALGMKAAAGLRGGIGGWISASEVYGMRGLAGRRGMGAWIGARQMPGVGVRGLGYGGAWGSGQYAFQPGMQSAFTM